jgi:hypothetical protein
VTEILVAIVSALVAGATAKAKEVASEAVSDAYNGLKSLIVRKLGKAGAVQSVEDDPESKEATASLASALAKQNLASDSELKESADKLANAVAKARDSGTANAGDIDIGSVRGRINATVEDLVATGRIHLGDVTAETGDAVVRHLRTGTSDSKNG